MPVYLCLRLHGHLFCSQISLSLLSQHIPIVAHVLFSDGCHVLEKGELRKALGEDVPFTDVPREYKEMVNKYLFGFGRAASRMTNPQKSIGFPFLARCPIPMVRYSPVSFFRNSRYRYPVDSSFPVGKLSGYYPKDYQEKMDEEA